MTESQERPVGIYRDRLEVERIGDRTRPPHKPPDGETSAFRAPEYLNTLFSCFRRRQQRVQLSRDLRIGVEVSWVCLELSLDKFGLADQAIAAVQSRTGVPTGMGAVKKISTERSPQKGHGRVE